MKCQLTSLNNVNFLGLRRPGENVNSQVFLFTTMDMTIRRNEGISNPTMVGFGFFNVKVTSFL